MHCIADFNCVGTEGGGMVASGVYIACFLSTISL